MLTTNHLRLPWPAKQQFLSLGTGYKVTRTSTNHYGEFLQVALPIPSCSRQRPSCSRSDPLRAAQNCSELLRNHSPSSRMDGVGVARGDGGCPDPLDMPGPQSLGCNRRWAAGPLPEAWPHIDPDLANWAVSLIPPSLAGFDCHRHPRTLRI